MDTGVLLPVPGTRGIHMSLEEDMGRGTGSDPGRGGRLGKGGEGKPTFVYFYDGGPTPFHRYVVNIFTKHR